MVLFDKKNVAVCAVVLFLIVVLLVSIVFAAKYEPGLSMIMGGDILPGSDHGVPQTPWYEVSNWEVAVCANIVGNEPTDYSQAPGIGGEYYHDLMLTMQAQKSTPLSGEAPVAPNSRIYEVAYFIQPSLINGETINFEVTISDDKGVSKSIASGSSGYVNGFRDYWVEESEVNYTNATLTYNNQRRTGTLGIPFVEELS
jgi:hypothetical protein